MRSALADIDLPAVHRVLHEAADASTTVPGVGVGAVRVAEAIRTAVVTVTWPDMDHHIVDLREGGWTIQHPMVCRPYLFDCPVNEAAEHELVDRPTELGRFVCGLDDDGRFEIGDRVAGATDA